MNSLDLTKNPSEQEFIQMLASRDDTKCDHVIWISDTGKLFITPLTNNVLANQLESHHQDMLCRFETLGRGNGYVGPDAAKDKEYVAEYFAHILKAWRVRHSGYISAFVEIPDETV